MARNTIESSGIFIDGSIAEDRKRLQPMLDSVWTAFGQSYSKFIAPSKDIIAFVAKKAEYPQPLPTNYPQCTETRYAYLVNGINTTYPEKMDSWGSAFRTFDQAGEITGSEWDPNVAFQFQVNLVERYDQTRRKHTGSLEPIIRMYAWGKSESNISVPTPKGFYLTQNDGGWQKTRTSILIYGDYNGNKKTIEQMSDEVTAGVSLIAPNIIEHGRRK